jgi:hypothetical protein
MPLSRITDHVQQGLALLLGQYRDKPRLAALLSSYLRRVQELEDAAWDTIVKRFVDDAEGAQLDGIGRIVGEVRQGRDDTTYRLFILARIRVNLSFGHGDDVIDVMNLVEAADFVLREFYPATMHVDFDTATVGDPVVLVELARMAKGAGVRLQLLYGDHDVGDTGFSFVDGSATETTTTEGSALTDESTGGYLSGALE